MTFETVELCVDRGEGTAGVAAFAGAAASPTKITIATLPVSSANFRLLISFPHLDN
jgi:hypothetical protein